MESGLDPHESSLWGCGAAVASMLLITAGLFLRSLQRAEEVYLGFETDNVLMASVSPGSNGYDEESGRKLVRTVMERVQVLPGVLSASFSKNVPFGFNNDERGMFPEGRIPADDERLMEVFHTVVGTGYFRTMRTPLIKGRLFTEHDDTEVAPVVIINEALAERFWPGEDPIGKRMSSNRDGSGPFLEVVGVAKNGKYNLLGEPQMNYMYLPFAQNYTSEVTLLVHAGSDAAGLAPVIRAEVRALDPTLPVFDVRTLERHVYDGKALLPARFAAALIGAFGFLGLVLATVGIYGVLSYHVSRRTHEIGIRMALGADGASVMKMLLWDGIALASIGTLVGLVSALGLTRLVENLLVGVGSADPATYAGVTVFLAVVTVAACFVPAFRATRVDPMVALRHE